MDVVKLWIENNSTLLNIDEIWVANGQRSKQKKATIRFICEPEYDDIMKSQNEWLSITQTNPLVTIFKINNTKVTPILGYVWSD